MSGDQTFDYAAKYPRDWPWKHDRRGATPVEKALTLPKISVVTPSFNQAQFLEASILSVLHQDYPNIEYIVLDGGSTDSSVEIIQRYQQDITYWHSKRDRGQADALATGFEMASGELYCWLNSDDVFLPDTLMHVARLFSKHEKVSFVYGNRLVIDETGRVTGRHRWPYFLTKHHWYFGQPVAQECCFWSSDLYKEVGGVDRNKFFIVDYDLFYRMWRVGKFKKTRRYLGCLRCHAGSKNAKHQAVRQKELATARIEFDLTVPGYVTTRVINHLDRLQLAIEEFATI